MKKRLNIAGARLTMFMCFDATFVSLEEYILSAFL
jgi:hypothetical protein